MNKNTLIKPTLALFTSAFLVLTGNSIAHSNDSDHTPASYRQVGNKQTPQDAQLLINAVSSNRLAVIKQLVNNGVNIDTPAKGDGTALMLAVKHNNLAMVKGLINLGADINQTSSGDGNPLIVASTQGHLDMVKHLVGQNADINAVVKGDETALINASRKGHFSVVQYLVEQGADVNLVVQATTLAGTKEERSPLNQANSATVRDYLRSQGANK